MSETTQKFEPVSLPDKNLIAIRKATIEDIGALVSITKECFPDHIGWHVDHLSEKYWIGVVNSPSSEVWLWIVEGNRAAFSHIITDIPLWVEEKKRYEYGIATKLFSLLTHPALIPMKIRYKINESKGNNVYVPVNIDVKNNVLNEYINSRSNDSLNNRCLYYGGICFDPEKVMWVELAGVLPAYRKYGLALRIIRYSNKRAENLRRKIICGVIELNNKSWCFLHERTGYVSVYNDAKHSTFAKVSTVVEK